MKGTIHYRYTVTNYNDGARIYNVTWDATFHVSFTAPTAVAGYPDVSGSYQVTHSQVDVGTTGSCPITSTEKGQGSGTFDNNKDGHLSLDYVPGTKKAVVHLLTGPNNYETIVLTDCNGNTVGTYKHELVLNPNCVPGEPQDGPLGELGFAGTFTASGDQGGGTISMDCSGRSPDGTQQWQVTGSLTVSPRCAPPYKASGPDWAGKYPGSRAVTDLAKGFRQNVQDFIAAMRKAGITVGVAATYRPYERSYLMHFSWLVAKSKLSPDLVPPFDPPAGATNVNICWDHWTPGGTLDQAASVAAAQKLLTALGVDPSLKLAPALTSDHNKRLAIDMTTTWTRRKITIEDADGNDVVIDSGPRTGLNPDLMAVGQTYGVIHFCDGTCAKKKPADDANHWSVDGH